MAINLWKIKTTRRTWKQKPTNQQLSEPMPEVRDNHNNHPNLITSTSVRLFLGRMSWTLSLLTQKASKSNKSRWCSSLCCSKNSFSSIRLQSEMYPLLRARNFEKQWKSGNNRVKQLLGLETNLAGDLWKIMIVTPVWVKLVLHIVDELLSISRLLLSESTTTIVVHTECHHQSNYRWWYLRQNCIANIKWETSSCLVREP